MRRRRDRPAGSRTRRRSVRPRAPIRTRSPRPIRRSPRLPGRVNAGRVEASSRTCARFKTRFHRDGRGERRPAPRSPSRSWRRSAPSPRRIGPRRRRRVLRLRLRRDKAHSAPLHLLRRRRRLRRRPCPQSRWSRCAPPPPRRSRAAAAAGQTVHCTPGRASHRPSPARRHPERGPRAARERPGPRRRSIGPARGSERRVLLQLRR
jgi:hypothetical protein